MDARIRFCDHTTNSFCTEPLTDQDELGEIIEKSGVIHTTTDVIDKVFDLAEEEGYAPKYVVSFNRYERPSNLLSGLFSRFLGPLPDPCEYEDATKENLKKIKSYRSLALVTLLAAVALLFALSYAHPIMRMSPLLLVTMSVEAVASGWVASLILFVLVTVLVMATFRIIGDVQMPKRGGFINQAAQSEELWFRAGAENWSTYERIKSCALFGLFHITNLFYPVCSLIVLSFVGGIFMWVYLRAYKQTGSSRIAVQHPPSYTPPTIGSLFCILRRQSVSRSSGFNERATPQSKYLLVYRLGGIFIYFPITTTSPPSALRK